jgi:nucleoside 2-deoxyribosyltransferase
MKIYIAGPLFTQAERQWNAKLASALRQRCTAEIALPQDFCRGTTSSKVMFSRCLSELTTSQAVVLNADGADVDAGSAFEAGVAHQLGIQLVSYRTDLRRAGDSEFDVNLMLAHAGAFLNCHGDTVDTVASKLLKEIRTNYIGY